MAKRKVTKGAKTSKTGKEAQAKKRRAAARKRRSQGGVVTLL